MQSFLKGNEKLQAFSQLETLRLCGWSSHTLYINDIPLELTNLHRLRRLYIEDWSPKNINVTASCQVYAVWQRPLDWGEPQQWLLSPCWTASNIKLVSLQFDIKRRPFTGPNEISGVMTIMKCHAGLELVRIKASRIGSEEVPFILPIFFYEGRIAPLKVEINTSSGCWLGLTETLPSSRAMILNTAGPLHIGLPATHETLTWYALEGCSASNVGEGPSSLEWQLAQALSPAQSTKEVEDHAINGIAIMEDHTVNDGHVANDVAIMEDHAEDGGHVENDAAMMEDHAAYSHKRRGHALRCIKNFVGQCWGMNHPCA